jgi:lipid-binding SYLF domain-containing protein
MEVFDRRIDRMRSSRLKLTFASLLFITLAPLTATAQANPEQTLQAATNVLDEIMAVPTKQIPKALLANARGIAIVPNVVKGGFVVGLRHGRGVILVRDDAGNWQPPMFASLTGGSVGWQAGIQATDVVLVFKTRRSVNGLINGKLTIGPDAAVAAGPVGRQVAAATDATLSAEILSYSRSRGLFAGVSLDGSALQLDHLAGNAYYKRPIVGANGQAIRPLNSVPASALRLMNQLAAYTGSPAVARAEDPRPQAGIPVNNLELSQTELVKRQLVSSWRKLSVRLDGRWNEYLALPNALLVGQPVDAVTLRAKLQQYDAVATNQQYRLMTQSPEFSATYQLLREYVALQPPPPNAKFALPPPPIRGN